MILGRELIVKLTLFWQPLRRPLPCDEEPLYWLLQKESSQQAHRTLQIFDLSRRRAYGTAT